MASASRSSAAYDRRTNGAPDPDRQRGHLGSSKQDMPDSNPSPQTYAYHQSQSTSHKRSASGNPRPMSRANNDDRRLEERRTEIRTVTHRETLVARSKTPEKYDRRAPERERPRHPEPSKPRAPEARPKEPKAEEPQAWNPEATLLPHTTAPLASRISVPPLASQAPASLQPQPLGELSLEEQEAAIVEDLLFVFMGYEGQYIRFAKTYNPNEERDRLSGPTFRILPDLDPSLQDLTQSMLKMATYYSALEAFVDVQSRDEFGAVNHALCASVRKFLHDYLILITQLETQFLTNDTFTIHILSIHTLPTSQMMLQLYSLAQEFLKKNALLDDDESEDDDDEDDEDNYENILESLREGGELAPGNMTGKKVCKGGVVLGLISKRLETMSGDPATRALLTTLLRDASRPYMAMLNEWLHRGGIRDPHSEFLIREQKSIRRERLEEDYTDEYWERRYTIREQEVPPQLAGVKDKVLLAGKYLNVVRECGGVDVSKEVKDVPTSFDDPRFLENVNNAYAHANESLMHLLLTNHSLPARLQSMKHYFFLDPSDYFSYFLELGASELKKPVKSVNTGKLQSLLDLVLRQPGSAVSLDPFKEDVKVEINEVTLLKSLQRVVNITGIEQGETLPPLASQAPVESDKNAIGFNSLQLDYTVPFPVSLVISRKTVWRYQALFRYLLSLRHLEAQLSTTWHVQTSGVAWAHKSSSVALQAWKRRVWTLRARMLIFVQQLLYFCTSEVIEPNWQKFMARVQARANTEANSDAERRSGVTTGATSFNSSTTSSNPGSAAPPPTSSPLETKGLTRTVDELMQDHVDFLDTCLKECMMTNSKLLRIHSKLMQTCAIFCAYSNWLTRELEKTDPDLSGTTKPPGMTDHQWLVIQSLRTQRGSSSADQSALGSSTPSDASASTSNHDVRVAYLSDTMRKWESNFSRHLQILLDALNHYAATETVVLLSLCARLSTANQGTEYAGPRREDDGAI